MKKMLQMNTQIYCLATLYLGAMTAAYCYCYSKSVAVSCGHSTQVEIVTSYWWPIFGNVVNF